MTAVIVDKYKIALEQHLSECDYRYRKLEEKMDQVENRLDHIEQLLLQIKTAVAT